MLFLALLLPVAVAGLRLHRSQQPADLGPLCLDGKLVPELFLLGAQKAATTTLSARLICGGIRMACNLEACDDQDHFLKSMGDSGKSTECHHLEHLGEAAGETAAVGSFRGEWLDKMPSCPAEGAGPNRSMLGDYTPSYLRLVPEVPGGRDSWPAYLHNANEQLKSMYGPAANRLRFVVLLREPLSRMHSAFHQRTCCKDCHSDQDRAALMEFGQESEEALCNAPNFSVAVRRALSRAREDPPVVEDWLWASMYGAQLSRWTTTFDAAQFLILPYRRSADQSPALCMELREWLHYNLDCSTFLMNLHANNPHRKHPRILEDEIDPELREDYDSFMKTDRELLLSVLSSSNFTLGLFPKEPEVVSMNEARVNPLTHWLVTGW